MSLAERRDAIKAKLDKAKKAHRSTRALQREYEILTAGILAEKLEADKKWPRHEPCAQVNPLLWLNWCQIQGRDPAPSDHWTEFDVVEHIVRKQARRLQDTSALP